MLDPLYCNVCNRGNLDGPTIKQCRRQYCDARRTAEKLDLEAKQERWRKEREAEAAHQPIPTDQFDSWSSMIRELLDHVYPEA